MEDCSSEDFQYVEDLDHFDDDFCVADIEEEKIDQLTKQMNEINKLLSSLNDSKLLDLDNIKRNFLFLCDNNRYLIDDSIFLKRLELNIYDHISSHEDKLFEIYHKLVNEEDKLINDEMKEKDKSSYDSIIKQCGLPNNFNKNKGKHKLQIDFEKVRPKEEYIFSYNYLKELNVTQFKFVEDTVDVDYNNKLKAKAKDFEETKSINNQLKTNDFERKKYNKSINNQKINNGGLKNIDEINNIDELKEEYYKRIDLVIDNKGSVTDNLSTANELKIFDIKEKIISLQNKI